MARVISSVEYYYATVEDRPGEGRKMLEYLSAHGVNLYAFTSFPIGKGRSQLDFFPDNPKLLLNVSEEAEIPLVGPKRAFLIQGDDEPGSLIEYHLLLADAGINVHAGNGVVDGTGRFGYVLWVEAEDYDRAAEVLGVD